VRAEACGFSWPQQYGRASILLPRGLQVTTIDGVHGYMYVRSTVYDKHYDSRQLWCCHCDKVILETTHSSYRPSDQANRLGLWVRLYTGSYRLHPPSSPFSIAQPDSWYSLSHPTEGRRQVDLWAGKGVQCESKSSPLKLFAIFSLRLQILR